MNRVASAVLVVRPGARGETCLLALRRPQSLTSAGYWTFVGEPLTATDSPPLTGEQGPAETDGHAFLDALAHSAQRSLALHAGLWPLAAGHPQGLGGAQGRALARKRLLMREASVDEAMAACGLSPSQLAPLVPLGGWRAPPYVARPTDVALFGVVLGEGEAADIDGPAFGEGAFEAPHTWLHRWHTDACALGAMELEVLRVWQASAAADPPAQANEAAGLPKASATSAARWARFVALWQREHPPMEALREPAAGEHRPSPQTPTIEALPVRSPTLAPATHTNCYAVGRQQVAVIDPGTPYADEQPKLMQWLEARQAAGSVIEQVWITHHHADHIGAAHAVRERFGARVLAHRLTAEALEGHLRIDATLEDEQALGLGDVCFRALFTPGHARGHLCFFDDATGHLFSGDNVLGLGTSIVVPPPDGDMRAYMQNLQRLLALDARLLFPGHGPPTARAIDRILDTLRQRQARERALLDIVTDSQQPLSLDALLGRLYRGIAPAQRRLAALSLRAHVEKLVADGALRWQLAADGAAQVALAASP